MTQFRAIGEAKVFDEEKLERPYGFATGNDGFAELRSFAGAAGANSERMKKKPRRWIIAGAGAYQENARALGPVISALVRTAPAI